MSENTTVSVTLPKKNHPKAKKSNLVRGKPKSGRVWKSPKQRFKSIIKTTGLQSPLEKKQKLREELKRVKEASRALVEERKRIKEEKRERTKENRRRQEENCKRAEVVQVIKNPSKIKKMKRKQLRYIEKRDTNVAS